VIAERPDLVIWQVGTNAFLRRDDWTADSDAIRRGIERLRQSDSDVVLMDMQYAPRVTARPTYADMQRRIADAARRANVGLFRRFDIMRHWHAADPPDAAPAIGTDGLHMTDRSYACIAAGLADAIAANWRRYEREAERARAARVARAAAPATLPDDFGGGEDP
jgi:lysophospholipase L1-like esterase